MKAIDLFEKTITRSEDMLDLHIQSFKRGRPVTEGVPADVLRSVVVFSMAAFDTYIHKRVSEVIAGILKNKKRVPEKCISILVTQIPTKRRERDEKITDVARTILEIALRKDSAIKIKQLIESGLSGQTFQKASDVQNAGKMMEVEGDIWEKINSVVSSNKKGPKRKGRRPDLSVFLDDFAERRNMIVHESDTYSSKKHNGGLRKITRTEVRDGIGKLKRIVKAIEQVSLSSI